MKNLLPLLSCLCLLLMVIAFGGCTGTSRSMKEMDKAETLMTDFPDSSLQILDDIHLSILSSSQEKARYALLKSMAYDKNYIDTISFEILQPAIDYYIKKGSPDEKLLTLYYQGRIFQNRKEDEKAMECFIKAIDLKDQISDSVALGRTYVAQSFIFEKQGMYEEYAQSSLSASHMYKDLGQPNIELEWLSSAINANIILNNKEKADSLIEIASAIEKEMNSCDPFLLHSRIVYATNYQSNEQIINLLDSIQNQQWDDEIFLDIANGFNSLGISEMGNKNLEKVQTINEANLLKYLFIKSDADRLDGKYKEALTILKEYIEKSDSLHSEIYSQEIASVEQRYQLEKNIISEKKKKNMFFLSATCICLGLLSIISLILIRFRDIKIKNLKLNQEKLQLEIKSTKLKTEKQVIESQFKEQSTKYQNQLEKNKNLSFELSLRHKEYGKQRAEYEKQLAEYLLLLREYEKHLEDNEKQQIEYEKLIVEYEKHLKEYNKQNEEYERLRKTLEKLGKDYADLGKELAHQEKISEDRKKDLNDRVKFINGLLASKITSEGKYSKAFQQLEKDLKKNKKNLLKILRENIEMANPQFMEEIINCGLTDLEIEYVCLYALGLRGKEIGAFFETAQHYNISSEIRKKLRLGPNQKNLGAYVISKLNLES